jgi:hypothetical protein
MKMANLSPRLKKNGGDEGALVELLALILLCNSCAPSSTTFVVDGGAFGAMNHV